jgi:hypothetical protein
VISDKDYARKIDDRLFTCARQSDNTTKNITHIYLIHMKKINCTQFKIYTKIYIHIYSLFRFSAVVYISLNILA